MLARAAVLVAVLALAAFAWHSQARGPESVKHEAAPNARSTKPIGLLGCAATACHGNPNCPSLTTAPDAECWRSSLTHWRAVDPHRSAYRVLTADDGLPGNRHGLAARMMSTLAKADAAPPRRAFEDERCLACHTNPSLAKAEAHGLAAAPLRALRSEGVSCEGCHGNAGDWQLAHVRWKGTAGREAEYDRFHMTKLYDLGERAMACAGCHVGSPADDTRGFPRRDVNHDLIAAGHPRLNFEFAEYQRRLPPHWLETDASGRDLRDVPGVASKAWLVGKVAAAEAACRLLADRAKDDKAPWPEFAESNCFACHHDLLPQSWRQEAPAFFQGRSLGAAPWQTHWPFKPTATLKLPDWNGKDSLARLFEVIQTRRPDREKMQAAAEKLANDLRATRLALAKQSEAAALASMRELLLGPSLAGSKPGWLIGAVTAGERDRLTWDEAGQAYLGFVAFERDRARWVEREGQPRDPEPAAVLSRLRDALTLPRAPHEPTTFNSPTAFTPAQVRGLFRRLREVIPPDERYVLPNDE